MAQFDLRLQLANEIFRSNSDGDSLASFSPVWGCDDNVGPSHLGLAEHLQRLELFHHLVAPGHRIVSLLLHP